MEAKNRQAIKHEFPERHIAHFPVERALPVSKNMPHHQVNYNVWSDTQDHLPQKNNKSIGPV